jgi:hypothetical protein
LIVWSNDSTSEFFIEKYFLDDEEESVGVFDFFEESFSYVGFYLSVQF